MQRLDGQVAIVTGGARGIGRGIGEVLGLEGARVALADVDGEAAEAAATGLRERGVEAVGLAADVTDARAVDSMVASVLDTWGRVDILAANAGIYPFHELAALDDETWNRVLDLNVTGAVRAVRACLAPMREQGYGRIVLTSSITGPVTGQVGFAHYGASKAAMLGFMRSAAVELARTGITVNAVMPGNVATEGLEATSDEHQALMLTSIPMGRYAEPADVGWAVRFLASPEAAYITGQTLIVDGGQVLPEATG
jgi:3-oxoacyl-[acyl-carrier protein] reductase